MVLWAVCCAPSSCNSPTKGYLEQRMALLYSAIWNKYLGWVNCFPVSGIATGAEEQLLTRVSFSLLWILPSSATLKDWPFRRP